MARGESQGLQIALIIFVILTIILSVTTFIFFKNAEEAVAKSESDQKAANDANTAKSESDNNLEWLKQRIGIEHDATKATSSKLPTTDIQKVFDEDMKNVLANFPEAKQTYRDAMTAILAGYVAVHAKEEEDRVQLKTLEDKVALIEKQKAQTHADELAKAATAEEELTKRTAEFAKKDKELTAEKEKLAKELDERATQADEAQKAAEKKQLDLEKVVTKKEQLNKSLKDKVEGYEQTTFEVSDGEIWWVNQTGGTVWINLGSADALPKQMKFSVWGQDENDVARTTSKAKIEVIKILDAHMAEARILEDSISDPILRGDKIFTSLWSPGRQEHFALAGFMDINGDGEDDRKTIKELIALSGGVVDAELVENKVTDGKGGKGQMTINTRYLVLGVEPKESKTKWSEMYNEAEELGVKKITLDKFLDHVGYKQEGKAVRFGRYADPKDFQGITSDGNRRKAAGVNSGLFKKRTPRDRAPSKTGKTGTAY